MDTWTALQPSNPKDLTSDRPTDRPTDRPATSAYLAGEMQHLCRHLTASRDLSPQYEMSTARPPASLQVMATPNEGAQTKHPPRQETEGGRGECVELV